MNLKKTNIITINYYDITIWSPIWLLFIFFCKVTMVVGLIQRKTLKSLKSTEYVTIFVQFFYLWFPVLSTEYVTIFVQFFHLWLSTRQRRDIMLVLCLLLCSQFINLRIWAELQSVIRQLKIVENMWVGLNWKNL